MMLKVLFLSINLFLIMADIFTSIQHVKPIAKIIDGFLCFSATYISEELLAD